MLYFDLRMFVFLLQDWKMLTNWAAIFFIFAFSGKQRTEILFRTKAYYILKLDKDSAILKEEEEDEQKEGLKAYATWKPVILLYEIAQTLSLFHTVAFWAFWYPDMKTYYDEKEPSTEINKVMRVGIMIVINTIPSIFMIFDLIFSKIIFRLRHFIVGLILSAMFQVIQYAGLAIIKDDSKPIKLL